MKKKMIKKIIKVNKIKKVVRKDTYRKAWLKSKEEGMAKDKKEEKKEVEVEKETNMINKTGNVNFTEA